MLGFDAEARLIQKLSQDFAAKFAWGLATHITMPRAPGMPWPACAKQMCRSANRPHDRRQRGPTIRGQAASRGGHIASALLSGHPVLWPVASS